MRRKMTTVEDLERMTPAERQADFDSRVVTDLSTLPPAYLERIRAKFAPLIAERDAQERSDRA